MVGMLSAIPRTPLYARLAGEGRLDGSDEPAFGTNVLPLRMSREELRDGYREVMRELYEPGRSSTASRSCTCGRASPTTRRGATPRCGGGWRSRRGGWRSPRSCSPG